MHDQTTVQAGRVPRGVWQLTAIVTLAALGAVSWVTLKCQAQIVPFSVLSDGETFALVIYQGSTEVGRLYRDAAGPVYNEHWVLYPTYSFDQARQTGASITIVAQADRGYASVDDFLARVPFPPGSRYVLTQCQEFNRLPNGR